MAIYTPRGLKIRLSVDQTFALMSRLYPEVDAFHILKLTEGLEAVPTMLGLIAGLICFYFKVSAFQIGILVFVAGLAGELITTFGLFFIPGLPKLGELYSYLSGYGIWLLITIVFGFISVGWLGVAAFFIGKFLALGIGARLDMWNMKRIHSKTGLAPTKSEVNFFNAYRLYANKLGKSTNIDVSQDELKEENW